MLMLKNKFAKLAMGLIVTSIISVGAISPVSAMESQPNLYNNAETKTQCEVMKDSCTNEHAAAQFTLNEDGEKALTVTPKSDFRSHNENFQNGADEDAVADKHIPKSDFKWNNADLKDGKNKAPLIAVETPIVETPVVETLVIDEETPVIDEDATDESKQNGFYSHLLDAYDKLLTLYDKLLNSFELEATN